MMHILVWVLNTSPKLHLWQNALNSLRFEPVLGPQHVPVTHPRLPRDLWQRNAGLVIQTPAQFWNIHGQHGKKTESGLACGCFFQHPVSRGCSVSNWVSGSSRRTVLELGRRLGVKGPGRAQQPTASPKALEEEFTKIICFTDFFLSAHLSYLLSHIYSAYGSGKGAGIVI